MEVSDSIFREIDRAVVYGKRAGYVEAMLDAYLSENGLPAHATLHRYWLHKAEQVYPWPPKPEAHDVPSAS